MSIPGTYVHSRFSTQSFASCAEAEDAMSDANALPYKKTKNSKPTIYLSTDLGSSFHIQACRPSAFLAASL